MSEPLASKLRPTSLKEFYGQDHLVGRGNSLTSLKEGPIYSAIKNRHLFSFILWGPPGVGKTTLAKIYANSLDAKLYEISAVSAGKDDIKKILNENSLAPPTPLDAPQGKSLVINKPKILFLDEIHRFNKSQQDFLLPYVENGALTLIGATTENPSFEVIPALLSRCRVFVMNELSEKEMAKIISKTLIHINAGDKSDYVINKEARNWLISMANGDARQAIDILENTARLHNGQITTETLKNTLQSKFLRYDKKGDEHYNTISAFIKSMRASQPDASIYYLARMIDAGEDPKFIARRMVIFASEDIGLAQPTALVVANEVFRAVEIIGLPECAINLAQGASYLALSPKSRLSYNAYGEAMNDVKKHGNLPVPLKIRNAPTKLMEELNYGKDYEKYTKESFLPDKLKNKKYLKTKNGK